MRDREFKRIIRSSLAATKQGACPSLTAKKGVEDQNSALSEHFSASIPGLIRRALG